MGSFKVGGLAFLAFLFGSLTKTVSADKRVILMQQSSGERPHKHLDSTGTNGPNVFCIFPNWGQYLPGNFKPADIDLNLCPSYIVYAWTKIVDNHITPTEWNDESTQWTRGQFDLLNDLKNSKPGLRTLLSVGGAKSASAGFSVMAASAATRKSFIDHVISYLRKWRFDGINIDWEYPTAADRDNFKQLLQELRAAFENEAASTHKDALLLMVVVSARKPVIDDVYNDVPTIVKSADFVNLWSFDFHTSDDPYTGINNPLYKASVETGLNATLNKDWAVQYWLAKGVPAAKLNMGVSFYGSSFTLRDPNDHGIYSQAIGAGEGDQCKRSIGCLSYTEICNRIQSGKWTSVKQTDQKATYAYRDYQWVGYDDVDDMPSRGAYIKSNRLAGAIVWAIALDDFNGKSCGKGPYPLLNALVNGMS